MHVISILILGPAFLVLFDGIFRAISIIRMSRIEPQAERLATGFRIRLPSLPTESISTIRGDVSERHFHDDVTAAMLRERGRFPINL